MIAAQWPLNLGRSRMRRPIIALLVLLASTLAGCNVTNQRRADALTDTLSAYGSAVRWGGWAQAMQFVDPTVREAHPLSSLAHARYQQVRVSEYDAGPGPVPLSKNEVRQVARINLINKHTQVERSIIDRQLWKYDPKTQHWWLESGLPDITQGE
jgi:hypothetical protein